MCFLAFAFHSLPDQPLVIAANRDEYYDRPSRPPELLRKFPSVLAGRDVRAGGTWLGLNEHGVIAGLTNRCSDGPEPIEARSRGLLCLDALGAESARAAVKLVGDAAARQPYNPFSLLVADIDEAWYVSNVDEPEPVKLQPGWFFLANGPLGDPGDPRVRRAQYLLERNTFQITTGFSTPLAALCRDHGETRREDAPDAICRHGKRSGTRSSSIIMGLFAKRFRYWHAEGAPCQTDYAEVPIPWQKADPGE